jgi:hypothetical protein
MARSLYSCQTEGAVALAAATAKTVIGVKAHANSGLELLKMRLSFDGVTASAVPVLVEVMYSTWATNSPGTNSTSTTPRQVAGRVLTAGFTSGKTWTTEPTALTVIEEFLITPYAGTVLYDWPLGDAPDCALAEGFVVRLTAPAVVNARSVLWVARN